MIYSIYGAQKIARAEAFATAAHYAVGQRRKFTNEPYIVHPRAVAAIIQALPDHTWQQVVLAWLHDTVEDTGVTLDVIEEMFGADIRYGMHFLTNVEREAGNRKARHTLNIKRLAGAPALIQTVKVADIKDNTKNIAALGGSFAPVFLQEKLDAMAVLTNADQVLWSLTMDQILKQKEEVALVQEA
ncbi:bifunctional (p)ppGpp synthetase/guanosine-3',5'-bis(diphosphate) 3'-pyrophosphohydrolase [Rhizobium bangladeshense]|uniref:HD domain-containing protein n=1 Tax=Rhizobium bangladeshense TaxID=1138189 RepID=UPI001C83D46E|nr:HD domain-containing protein [Rhizobium bangladeshense]MBX4911465.1 bifunctional (p)ppGpp synthetase/guanosine-3',5'-bis(diphosphate) 3'-pyrophosphohydrolase [Rhizobium bangladeshense]